MTARQYTVWDIDCDHEGCRNCLSEQTDRAYVDDQQAREWAEGYDWQHTADGRDLCPDHAATNSEETP